MPRFPAPAASAVAVGASPFSGLYERAVASGQPLLPLHVGDTWMAPPRSVTEVDLPPTAHRYAPPRGLPALVNALADDIGGRHGVAVDPADLVVSAGATEGLALVAGALLAPGDEVLILAPHWPLVRGIVTWNRGVATRVDLLGVDDADVIDVLAAHVSERTVAIYVNTPSNPTGRVLGEDILAGIAELAREHDLWLWADEVYEHHQFVGEHVPLRRIAPERTVSVHSLSKSLGLAGYRVGAVVTPPAVGEAVLKVRTHASYNTATASQHLALEVLAGPAAAWLHESRVAYERVGEQAAAALGMPGVPGGTFLFVDVADGLDERGLGGLLEDCADQGLLLAPGPSFGPYPHHVRLCFTCAPPEVTLAGTRVLAERIARR